MALTICTGFVVDDAIVVIENISRHIEAGIKPYDAGDERRHARVGFTVLSMSTSLVAVFIPILMMGGIVGRLFREFAVVLRVWPSASHLFVSLTYTPMMCARFLRHESGSTTSSTGFRNAFNRFLGIYDILFEVGVLRHQFLILLVTIGTVCLNGYLFYKTPKGLLHRSRITRAHQWQHHWRRRSFFRRHVAKDAHLTDIVAQDPAVKT